MRVGRLAHETDFGGWRAAARSFRLAGLAPGQVRFEVTGADQQGGLFDILSAHPGESRDPVLSGGVVHGTTAGEPAAIDGEPKGLGPGFRRDERKMEPAFTAPKAFVDMAREVILHRSADRFDLLYRLLWRLRAEPDLLKVSTDADVAAALERVKNVSRASHKMKAFVRFRQIADNEGERWVAWFEPAHRVLEKTAPFFRHRFSNMRWSILTPDGSAVWDQEGLVFGPPATRDMAPDGDEIEEFWKTYYASTFNPARLKTAAMKGEMPKRYWKNLPEAGLIPELVARSALRTETMVAAPASVPNSRLEKTLARLGRDAAFDEGFNPSNLLELAQGVQACRRCALWRDATQGVCGTGSVAAPVMIVGEQPGDQEDLAGRPFVGPAGQVLDEALAAAGLERTDIYVTNAVKHFKHEPRGKRRIHRTPVTSEISACRWWLDFERRLVRPRVIVTLGATAAQAVLNRHVTIREARGRPMPLDGGGMLLMTAHPAYLLRLPDEVEKRVERDRLIGDLKAARALV